ncbi:MAG: phage holin family protein [Elusimicrobia bacterium]|nr:phage holin family protein [Candidatus Liberimonas magnetica]
MIKLALTIVRNIISLKLITLVLPGIQAEGFSVLISASIVIWLLNLLLKPILFIITLPITLVTLGIFTFIINGFLFYLIPKFVSGFSVENFWQAILAALLFGFINFFLDIFFKTKSSEVLFHAATRQPSAPGPYGNVVDAEVVHPKDTKQIQDK